MKLNDWLFSIKYIFLTLSLLFCFSSCKKIVRKVDVTVYDASTGMGISGIDIFFDDESYITDSDGMVKIKKSRNIKDEYIGTLAAIPNYVNSNYPQTCRVISSYKIESKELRISLIKIKKLRLSFKKKGVVGGYMDSVCVKISDSDECVSEIFDAFTIRNDEIVDHPRVDNGAVYFAISRIEGEATIKFFKEYNCEFLSESDSIYRVPIIVDQDTINYVIYL